MKHDFTRLLMSNIHVRDFLLAEFAAGVST